MNHRNEENIAARVIELRRQGMSIRDIAHDLTMSKSAVGRLVAKYNQGAKGEPPPPMAVGEAVDRTDVDGTIELLKLERPATVEELMTLCELDPKRWIPQYMKANVWQGYGKIKMPNGESFKKVQLYQSNSTKSRRC